MSNIVKANGGTGLAISSTFTLSEVMSLGQQLFKARGIIPDHLKSPEQVVAVLLAGQELGLPPMVSLRSIQMVKGKIVLSYDSIVGLLRRAGYDVKWEESSVKVATVLLTAPNGGTHRQSFTASQAETAGLWGKNTWALYPDLMLRARCVSHAARAFAADVLMGIYTEDEADEIRASPSDTESGERDVPYAVDVLDGDQLKAAADAEKRRQDEEIGPLCEQLIRDLSDEGWVKDEKQLAMLVYNNWGQTRPYARANSRNRLWTALKNRATACGVSHSDLGEWCNAAPDSVEQTSEGEAL